jgi:hypothetical protein
MGLAHLCPVLRNPQQMWLPHLSRFSKGGRHEPQTLQVADMGWGSPPQGEKGPRAEIRLGSALPTHRKARWVGQPQLW